MNTTILFSFLALAAAQAADYLRVTPHADGVNIPVRVATDIDPAASVALEGPNGENVPGQVVDGQLHWILPKAKAGVPQKWLPGIRPLLARDAFTVKTEAGSHTDILFGQRSAPRPVTRLMTAFDSSSKDRAFETYKVYTHVFDESGKDFITKAVHGQFPHHRGIFIGWARTGFQGKRIDSWHMKGATQVLKSLPDPKVGWVLGQITPVIEWKTDDGTVFIEEHRTLTTYFQPGSPDSLLLLDFDTTLKAPNGDVELAGDPEHAGCQFRPHNDLSKSKAAKYLFHADGINPKKDRDLPWVSLAYPLRDKQYHVQHMSHPTLPKGNIYSAYRDYGRFGAYCKTTIKSGESLRLRYRYLVTRGGFPDRSLLQQNYEQFANPPSVEVIK